jgi:hypothetical protein
MSLFNKVTLPSRKYFKSNIDNLSRYTRYLIQSTRAREEELHLKGLLYYDSDFKIGILSFIKGYDQTSEDVNEFSITQRLKKLWVKRLYAVATMSQTQT